MKKPRYSTSRQKSCQQCAKARTKCERRAQNRSCERCARRSLACSLPAKPIEPTTASNRTQHNARALFSLPSLKMAHFDDQLPLNSNTLQLLETPGNPLDFLPPIRGEAPSSTHKIDTDFADLNLLCPINADDIQNRWIHAYIPVPGQVVKKYPNGVRTFIHRILKSYASMVINGQILPFIHPQQLKSQHAAELPLTLCLSLVRICSNPLTNDNQASIAILQQEMHKLYGRHASLNDEALFSAFQAYLIYVLVLYFRLDPSSKEPFRLTMTQLQDLASASARRGLVCAADALPRWEEWMVAEAKRRTLFVMYLFDSLLCAQENLPTFLGTELRGLPAPANKLLWQAATRYDWERAYHLHLADWMQGSLTIDELWPTPADLDNDSIARRHARVDHWLENLDEYGTMIYAVTTCTHDT
ncbi:hypothetical protein BC940DRAFT_297855 [Gongronella butleri]|nr:hypothetical protein BC940DRAFT_297855 [Gongronella butleri]